MSATGGLLPRIEVDDVSGDRIGQERIDFTTTNVICGFLKEAGIIINPATLKSYVHRIKSERGNTKTAADNATVSRVRRQSVKPEVNKAEQKDSHALWWIG